MNYSTSGASCQAFLWISYRASRGRNDLRLAALWVNQYFSYPATQGGFPIAPFIPFGHERFRVNCFLSLVMIPEGLTIALWTPSGSIFVDFLFLVLIDASRGLSGRPLDPFGGRLTSKALALQGKYLFLHL